MITPRPYQLDALGALHNHICTKESNPCVVIPTGGGKSLLIAWSIQGWKAQAPSFRCVVLAHRKELIQQNYEEFMDVQFREGFGLTNDIGIFSAGLKRKDWDASILFASIDSIYKRAGDFAPFDAILVDEAHRIPHSGEGKYLTFLKDCRRFNQKLRVIGWTATPFRMSTGSICHKDHLLHEVCYEAAVTDLIKDGFLCKLRSKVGMASPELRNVKKRGGEYIISSLAEVTNRDDLITKAVDEAVRILRHENRRSIIFFCVDVEHCHAVSRELQRHHIYAPAVTAKTKPEIRDRIGDDFKNGKLHAVCNVNVYTEGFNATCIDCIVLLRPTLSPGLFSQMVGRGLRLHPDKGDCLVLDFAGCIDEHGPIDLLGTGMETPLATCLQCRTSFSRAIRVCPECGWSIPKQELDRLEEEDAERKRRMHGDKASDRSILSNAPETHIVSDVKVSRHRKPGKPDSLVVRYRCGVRFFREWVCLNHEGFAGRKAQLWWIERFGQRKAHQGRATVSEALSNFLTEQVLSDYTKSITVKREGKYLRVIGYNEPIGGAA